MLKQDIYTIEKNICIAKNTYEMVIAGDTSAFSAPGQFLNIKLDGFYLRRPISVCNYDDNSITIIYKVVGKGTEKMAQLYSGEELDILCGLGNGFDTALGGDKPVVIGGGVGVPPMYGLAKALISQGKKVTAILGFNSADEVFYKERFVELGADVIVTTADGSVGIKGFVTDGLNTLENYTYFYTCGPEPMLKAVYNGTKTSGQLSFEERMGCGFGACMGCSCKIKYGNKRICKDGPVLVKEEIIW